MKGARKKKDPEVPVPLPREVQPPPNRTRGMKREAQGPVSGWDMGEDPTPVTQDEAEETRAPPQSGSELPRGSLARQGAETRGGHSRVKVEVPAPPTEVVQPPQNTSRPTEGPRDRPRGVINARPELQRPAAPVKESEVAEGGGRPRRATRAPKYLRDFELYSVEVASAGGEQRKGGRTGDQPGRKPEEICEGHERVAEKPLDEPQRAGKAKPELPGPVDPVEEREVSVGRDRPQKTTRALKDTKEVGLNPVAMGSARNEQSSQRQDSCGTRTHP